jgi:hypothetical protein
MSGREQLQQGGQVHPPLPYAPFAKGFHRIRHYGLSDSGTKAETIAGARADRAKTSTTALGS